MLIELLFVTLAYSKEEQCGVGGIRKPPADLLVDFAGNGVASLKNLKASVH